MNKVVFLFVLSFFIFTTKNDGHTIIINDDNGYIGHLIKKKNNVFTVKTIIDLKGDTLALPENSQLTFAKNTCIKNGVIVGNNTKLDYYEEIFEDVSIRGTWNAPIISTKMFRSLNPVNSLQNIFALSSDLYHNDIIIENGEYKVECLQNKAYALKVRSDTDLKIKGTITLIPNSFDDYDIIRIEDASNVVISGGGLIVGDKFNHLGSTGEWGMGISVRHSSNIQILDLNIENCWGDCIYVSLESENVQISSCCLDNGRRQGISIVGCKGCTIKDCKISNVNGTPPERAIDLEPNPGCEVSDIHIENVSVENCVGGFLCYGKAQSSVLKDITFINCWIDKHKGQSPAIMLEYVENATIRNCVANTIGTYALFFNNSSNLRISNNILSSTDNTFTVHQNNNINNNVITGNKIVSDKRIINSTKGIDYRNNQEIKR